MENIKFIVSENVKWYKGKDVANLLKYKNVRDAIIKHIALEDKCLRSELDIPCVKGEQKHTVYINDRGVKSLVSKSRMISATDIAKNMGFDILDHKYVTKEAETLDAITKSFAGEKMRLQHTVKDYRIDLYFPDYNLCIECDENGHNNYNGDADRQRTQIISDTLKCKWIRYNPDAKDFNIFMVINQIFTVIKMRV